MSPQISVRKNRAVFIEIGKCANLYSELEFIKDVTTKLKALGHMASIAIGDTIFTALLKARFNNPDVDSIPLGGLMDVADPFDKDIILQKYTQKMILAFQDLGVLTLGQFKKLPAAELSSRFGAVGVLCRGRLQNDSQIAWPYWKPTEDIIERTDFSNINQNWNLEPILFELKRHLDVVFQKLVTRGDQLQKLSFKIITEKNSFNHNPVREFEFDFLHPQASAKGALNIIKQRLERELQSHPIQNSVEALETAVLGTTLGTQRQKNLLHSHEETQEQLNSLINELQETQGRESIFNAHLTEDRRPEKSWTPAIPTQTRPPAQTPVQKKIAILPNEIAARVPERPLYLIKPVPIEVSADSVKVDGRSYKISKWNEYNERISGGWSDKAMHLQQCSYDRDYYQLEVEDGTQFTIFETPERKFYLQGYNG